MGFLTKRHDDEALTATGIAKIVQAKARPGLKWTSSYDGGTVKVDQGVDLPFGHATVQLRVTPDDGGAEFASEATLGHGDSQEYLDERRQTYVRYDPAHPEQCVIDCDRLEREFGSVRDGKRTTIPRQPGRAQAWAKQAAGDEQPAPAAAPDQPSSPTATAGGTGLADELSRLGRLHESGMLTDDEFGRAKARLIDGGA